MKCVCKAIIISNVIGKPYELERTLGAFYWLVHWLAISIMLLLFQNFDWKKLSVIDNILMTHI